jgi:membrane protease YdiL (CAAX protease family)
MDAFNLMIVILALSYFGVTIYMANYGEATGERRLLVRGLLHGTIAIVFVYALVTLQVAFLPLPAQGEPSLEEISLAGALVNFALAVVICLFSFRIVNSAETRQWLKSRIGSQGSFSPDSIVHTTAIVLSLAALSFTIGQLVLSGGISGMAESIEASGISLGDTIFNQVLWIVVALLGIGLFLRRTPEQALGRLGLRVPAVADIRAGVGVAVALYLFVFVLSGLWAALVTPEQFQEQTAASEQIAEAFNTVPLAFFVAVTVAVGEEVLFRGALQPVFGPGITAIYFALLHTQYTLTPASLSIFVVALALGWLRKRHSTTASIITHFIFNFVSLVLPLLFSMLTSG